MSSGPTASTFRPSSTGGVSGTLPSFRRWSTPIQVTSPEAASRWHTSFWKWTRSSLISTSILRSGRHASAICPTCITASWRSPPHFSQLTRGARPHTAGPAHRTLPSEPVPARPRRRRLHPGARSSKDTVNRPPAPGAAATSLPSTSAAASGRIRTRTAESATWDRSWVCFWSPKWETDCSWSISTQRTNGFCTTGSCRAVRCSRCSFLSRSSSNPSSHSLLRITGKNSCCRVSISNRLMETATDPAGGSHRCPRLYPARSGRSSGGFRDCRRAARVL